eukprot:2033027-Ditylum_brightwellii.AAC.2
MKGSKAGHLTLQLHMQNIQCVWESSNQIIFPLNTAAAHPKRAFFMKGFCPDVVSYCYAVESWM